MKRSTTQFAIVASILLMSLAPNAASAAVIINMNFLASSSATATTETNPGYGLWDQGTEIWNTSGLLTGTDLKNSVGTTTTVDYALVGVGTAGNTNIGTGSNFGPDLLTGQGKFGPNNSTTTITLTLTGLVAGQSYDLLTYHARNNPNETETANGSIPVNFTGGLTTTGGSTYIDDFDVDFGHFFFYDNVIADVNGQILVAASGANFETFTGFQLSTIPEPSAALLGGLGLLALLRRRR